MSHRRNCNVRSFLKKVLWRAQGKNPAQVSVQQNFATISDPLMAKGDAEAGHAEAVVLDSPTGTVSTCPATAKERHRIGDLPNLVTPRMTPPLAKPPLVESSVLQLCRYNAVDQRVNCDKGSKASLRSGLLPSRACPSAPGLP